MDENISLDNYIDAIIEKTKSGKIMWRSRDCMAFYTTRIATVCLQVEESPFKISFYTEISL